MNVNRQLINLVGIVVVAAVLAAGILLVAVPLYTQSLATDAQTSSVAQTNSVYDVQVTRLSAAESRIAEIDADLAARREEIPTTTQLDDVFQLIDEAVASTDATIESIKASDPEAWWVRPPVVDLTGTGVPAAEDAAAAIAAVSTPQTEDAEGAAADTAADAPPDGSSAEAPTADGQTDNLETPTTQRHTVVMIEVAVPDAAAATAFLDVLRTGDRLVLPVSASLEGGVLSAAVMAFVRTEDE